MMICIGLSQGGCIKALRNWNLDIVRRRASRPVDSREFEEKGTKGVLFLDVYGERGLVLNQTNLKTLMAAFGRKSENWVGQDVVVNRTLAYFKGKPVPAIRLEELCAAPRRHCAGRRNDAKVGRGARRGRRRSPPGQRPRTPCWGRRSPIGGPGPPPSAPAPTSYDGPADPADDIDF